MKTNNNIPAYRFQGYTDAWELRKLGEVGTVAMCRRIFKEQTSEHGEIPFYKIGTFGGTPDAFIARELFEEFKDKYSYPNIGDILISASGSIGRTVEFLGEDEYFQDSNIVWLKHDGKINNIFLKQFYSIVKWSGIEGSTIKRLYNENILNTEISLPSLPEQSAIGTFFSTLDRHITLHQRKLDTLKEQKKTYLKLLFPAKGQTKPALRFQGFEDDWEEVKLSDMILHEIKGKAKSEMLGSSAVYLETEYLNGGTKSFVDCEKDVEEDDILILWDGSQAGTVYHGFSGALGSTLKAYRPKESGKFIYYQLVSHQNLIFEKYRTPNIPHVIKTFTDEFHMFYTSHPEQEAIGSFFQTLDQEISQVEDKLASLKEMKKTLLRKLFV
ncbi:TPA: restriction endonuclease subunit S [Streptococcus suis]|nr:restriction endonuclease subunit S [Streptococcus suis]HEM6431798.1 restriction endonuclease subunit S [Streptococcus suis]